MRTRIESPYKDRWIELTQLEDDGLFFAEVRITKDPPATADRKWKCLETEIAVYFDFESASEDALKRAQQHVDKSRAH